MALNPSIGLAGIAIQADRDTPATEATFKHGLTGGAPFGVTRSIENTAVACGNRAPTDARVDSVEIAPGIESLCYPDVLGAYLYAALGKVVSSAVEGSEGLYKHVFTMGDKLPYCSIWSQFGDSDFRRADGCKCGTLELTATGNEHLAMSASFQGIDAEFGLSGIPGSAEASCFGGKYTTTECTFMIDTASETPAEALVSEVTFTIENNIAALTSLGRAFPRDIAEGNLSFGVAATTIPDDFSLYNKMLSGSADGTTITGKVVTGSVYSKFHHTENTDYTLEVEVNHVPFTADFPEVDPEGNEATIQFTSDAAIIKSSSESPVTITIVNGTASYEAV